MVSIHNLTCDDILDFMIRMGFKISHQKGSHIQLKKDDLRITIPNHGKKTLNIKTVISIFRQSGIDKDKFFK